MLSRGPPRPTHGPPGGVGHNRRGETGARDPYCPIPGQRGRTRPRGARGSVVRHTEFWARMASALGDGYAPVWAGQHVMGSLGERTAQQALDAGVAPLQVWRAVWAELDLPASER